MIACRAVVAKQCRQLQAFGLLRSPTTLLPMADLNLHVRYRSPSTSIVLPVHLTHSQLLSLRAPVITFTRNAIEEGSHCFQWVLNDQILHSLQIEGVSKSVFEESLCLLDDSCGRCRDESTLCFHVASRKPGMAGRCALTVDAFDRQGGLTAIRNTPEMIVTDGPSSVEVPTREAVNEQDIAALQVSTGGRCLGVAVTRHSSCAHFTNEGGIKTVEDYDWSAADEGILQERLNRLTEPPRS